MTVMEVDGWWWWWWWRRRRRAITDVALEPPLAPQRRHVPDADPGLGAGADPPAAAKEQGSAQRSTGRGELGRLVDAAQRFWQARASGPWAPGAAQNALGGAAARLDDFGGHAHLHMVRAQIRPRSSGSRASPVLLCRSQSMLACEVLSDRKRRGTTSIFQELLYLCSFRCKDPFPSLPVNI